MPIPTPNLFITLCGGIIYHDNQVQLENLFTIITNQRDTILELLDRLDEPNAYSL